MSPQFFWDSAALESLGSETRNNPKQPVIAMEIHVAVWLLVSSFGAPPNRIAPNICENNGIYHEVDSVNMSKHVQHVPKRLFSSSFWVAVRGRETLMICPTLPDAARSCPPDPEQL